VALIQQSFKLSSNFTELAIHRFFYMYMGVASGIIELRSGGSEKLFLIIIAILLAGLVLLDLIDNVVSIPNASVSGKEVTGNMSETNNFSASATITIAMTEILNE